MIEFANSLDSLLEFLIIIQPAAHRGNLFLVKAELSGASSGIANGEDPGRMALATGTFWTTAAVANEAVKE